MTSENRTTNIQDDGMIAFTVGNAAVSVDLLDVYYRLRAIQSDAPAESRTPTEQAAVSHAYLLKVRDEIMPELGFPASSLIAARRFSGLVIDLVLDVKKNSGAPPTSNASAAPDSSAAE